MDNELAGIEHRFANLCTEVGRQGVIGFAAVEGVRLLPEQSQRLQQKLAAFEQGSTPVAVSFGLFYREPEILAIPATWEGGKAATERWNDYARAYQELNRTLDHVSSALAAEFGGVAEKATIEGWAGKVKHVGDYFAHCVSHRAFAEVARLGWRGRHGLIVTPEAGPALRFATVFISGNERGAGGPSHGTLSPQRELAGCGECRACLDVCPILRAARTAGQTPADYAGGARDYREVCRRRLHALGLAADVCGICVRVCWERIRS